MSSSRRVHYAWVICLGGALVMCATMGLGVNVFTIYQPEIIAQNGFTNAQGSWITTVRSLFILGALFTVNQLCGRLGVRAVMTLGVALVGVSCFCFSFARSFPAYCFAAALTGLGYCYGGMVPLSLVIGAWFRSRRNLALGLAAAGSGVSTIFAPLIITRLIDSRGMESAFRWEGGAILAAALAVWLLLRNAPADLGLEPYAQSGGQTAQTAVRTARPLGRAEWALLLFAALLVGGPGGPGFSHLTVLFTTEGFDPVLVAVVISYAGALLSLGKIICGQVYDRLGGRLGNWYACGLLILGMLLCAASPLGLVFLPFAAVTAMGLGLPVSTVSPSVWAADLTRQSDYSASVRSLNVAYNIGVIAFGPVPGILADRFGSYVPAYLLFAGALALATVIAQAVYFRAGAGKRPRA